MENRLIQEKRKKKKIIILIIIILLIAVGITMCRVLSKQPNTEIIAGDFLPEGKDATKDEKRKAAAAKVDDSQFTLSIYPEAVFPKGSQEKGSIHLRNEATNAFPINVKIRLDNNQEVVYESGAINPGYEVKNVSLDKKLTAGDYKATAEVDIYDPKTKEKKGSTQAEITLYIKK